jgi:16S rRNA U1498 N3-methylase RsmE
MPGESIHDTIERQARRAIFEHAILRVENAVLLALAMLLVLFGSLINLRRHARVL